MSAERILVFAYSEVGHECLRHLLDRGENVVFVYTYSDPAEGESWPPSVRRLCEERAVPHAAEFNWKSRTAVEFIRQQRPDLIFSFYYRDILPPEVLALPPYGAYNMHGALLPKFRGRAPVNWAVLEGEAETGATLHVMVPEPDAGDIVDFEKVPIGPDETAYEVQQKVTRAAVKVLSRQLDALKTGKAPRRKQNPAEATVRGRRGPEDGAIDWRKSAKQIHDLVRAVTHPFPGAFTEISGERMMIWRTLIPGLSMHDSFPGQFIIEGSHLFVCCGDDRLIEILQIQSEGEPEKPAAEWLQTHALSLAGAIRR
jgi:methionyl-tRNA formyltransferase